jgi:hypothetical protein
VKIAKSGGGVFCKKSNFFYEKGTKTEIFGTKKEQPENN